MLPLTQCVNYCSHCDGLHGNSSNIISVFVKSDVIFNALLLKLHSAEF